MTMTEEQLKARKEKIKEEIELLKKDIITLQDIVTYLETTIDKVTLDNYKDIDSGLTKMTDKLQVVNTL